MRPGGRASYLATHNHSAIPELTLKSRGRFGSVRFIWPGYYYEEALDVHGRTGPLTS
jgi:hypothetical protein